ncbi:hypothetical protein K7711_38085 [Nocardia sp. CA2R105]|uniref:hypothetical protein n=1 Tax=Nocardia coffeae TaxID=2873381 RepID=UPI001CA7A98E|nr:hypothetical protein [Nocardia coffeae]MBY8862333.1 hypothetical protein [Nocardia coffeae]
MDPRPEVLDVRVGCRCRVTDHESLREIGRDDSWSRPCPDPTGAALAGLLAFRASRVRKLITLQVTHIRDGRLHLADRIVPLAEPVRQRRPVFDLRKLDKLNLAPARIEAVVLAVFQYQDRRRAPRNRR